MQVHPLLRFKVSVALLSRICMLYNVKFSFKYVSNLCVIFLAFGKCGHNYEKTDWGLSKGNLSMFTLPNEFSTHVCGHWSLSHK